MNLLKEDVRTLYFRYLAAAFGSSFISCIYGIVDCAMVGWYQGPDGTAAIAVISPVWNILFSLGLLTGIGGSVLFSTLKGRGGKEADRASEYFTVSCLLSVLLSVLVWAGLLFFETPLLRFFGGTDELILLARTYLVPLVITAPVFLWSSMLTAFLRNDNAPGLATLSAVIGGVYNMAADYFFVFVLDWGLFGAGFATATGGVITLLVLLFHFKSRNNTLRFLRPAKIGEKIQKIVTAGFSTFFVDIAMGILTVLMNRQIMRYLGTEALSVYAVVINIATFVQCCAYSVGQAAQPIFSVNFGAGNGGRIRLTLALSLASTAVLGVVWTLISLAVPNGFVYLFMSPTEEVLSIAPGIIRTYSLSFLLLPYNIFSTYCFQSLMKSGTALLVSLSRGMVVSGILILLLPALFSPGALWAAMPVTEGLVAVFVSVRLVGETRRLPAG